MGGPSYSTSEITYATTQSSQPTFICADTTTVPRIAQNRVQVGTGRGLGRKKDNARGTPFFTERYSSSSQLPPLLVLLEKKEGVQLVLVFTLILQLEPKY